MSVTLYRHLSSPPMSHFALQYAILEEQNRSQE